MNAADMSRLMTSQCLMTDFKGNVLNDVVDGVAAKVSTAGLLMAGKKPLATNRAFSDVPCCQKIVMQVNLWVNFFLWA